LNSRSSKERPDVITNLYRLSNIQIYSLPPYEREEAEGSRRRWNADFGRAKNRVTLVAAPKQTNKKEKIKNCREGERERKREREREGESAQVSTLMLTRGGSECRAMDVMDISTAASTSRYDGPRISKGSSSVYVPK